MDELIAFLRARYDERETNARNALAQWPETHFTIDPGSLVIVEFHRRHDPAAALASIAGNRKIVDMAEEQVGYDLPEGVHEGRDDGERMRDEMVQITFVEVLQHLAEEFAAHPDYKVKDWGPFVQPQVGGQASG
jgi:hypothetical protein